jgi:DNA/RNA-binding domain of Phe-tRNA-synthetase-like protein
LFSVYNLIYAESTQAMAKFEKKETSDIGNMEKALGIASRVYDALPDLVVIAGFLEPRDPDKESISAYLNESWIKLAEEVENKGLMTHPRIAPWMRSFQAAGIPVKKYPFSILAMGKRASKTRAPFSINPIVDTYNAVSMDLIIPGGAYDVDQMNGGLRLRLSDGGEVFQPLGNGKVSHTVPGEIVYSDDSDVLTRMFLWQQSDKAKIMNSSERLVFVFELLDEMGSDIVNDARRKIEDKFMSLLDAEVYGVSVQRK